MRPQLSRRFLALAILFASSVGIGLPSGATAATVASLRPPAAPAPRPSVLDPLAVHVGQNSCDPTAQPGTKALANLLLDHYGRGRSLGIVRSCGSGGSSEHKEGRAFDWGLNAYDANDKAVAEAFLDWVTRGDGARRLGVMYVIWNKRIWSSSRADEGWRAYSGASAHTDHIHISLSWSGAKQETSFWTGETARQDYGPCPVYTGHPAPVRTRANPAPCPVAAPSPFTVNQRTYWQGDSGDGVRVAQDKLGLTRDGIFGYRTREKVLGFQAARGLPRTGALDPVTWAQLVPSSVVSRTSPAPTPTRPATPKPVPPKPAPPKAKPTPLQKYTGLVLRRGSRGTAVRQAQLALGLALRNRTGYFGPITEKAVRRLQKAHKLPVTGRIDRRTWEVLERKLVARR